MADRTYRLSSQMVSELADRNKYGYLYVGSAEPGRTYKPHGLPHIRTLVALWRRGFVALDICARITESGRQALREHQRKATPGQRNFTVVGEPEDG